MINVKMNAIQTQMAMLTALVSTLQNHIKSLETRINQFKPSTEDASPSSALPLLVVAPVVPMKGKLNDEYDTDEEPLASNPSNIKPRIPRSDFVWIDNGDDSDSDRDGTNSGYDSDD